jgi:NADPH:quinone reductase-like Zn-dependent oxidoreductase
MKAAWIEKHGGPEVIQVGERDEPKPGFGEVVVRVMACSLNHLDLWVRKGGNRPFPLPLILGSDIAGIRVDTGEDVVVFPGVWHKPLPRPGVSVALAEDFTILGAGRDGGMAEFVAVPEKNCIPKPPRLAFEQAAAVPVAFTTAWHMLISRAQLRPGEWVLVNGAGSGVSTAAIQIAHLAGAVVIATTSTPDKVAKAVSIGCDYVINYKDQDVAEQVKELTGGRGVDVILDHVGSATWKANIASLARGGRLVNCGTTGGADVQLNLASFYYQAQSLLGSTLGTLEETATCLRLVAEEKFQVVIDRIYPLDELADAHRYLEQQEQFGKVVIQIK